MIAIIFEVNQLMFEERVVKIKVVFYKNLTAMIVHTIVGMMSSKKSKQIKKTQQTTMNQHGGLLIVVVMKLFAFNNGNNKNVAFMSLFLQQ